MRAKYFLLTLIAAAAIAQTPVRACDAKPVQETAVIDQPPQIVWQAIQQLRTSDHAKRTLVSYQNGEAIIEEKFPGLPVIGDAICTYKECEEPRTHEINYSMISSDRFKVFEGTWKLTPLECGKTSVSLSSTFDPGLRIPFWKEISRAATLRTVKRRLSDLSNQCHKIATEQASLSSAATH